MRCELHLFDDVQVPNGKKKHTQQMPQDTCSMTDKPGKASYSGNMINVMDILKIWYHMYVTHSHEMSLKIWQF